jgi:aspartate aminotransferase-like enzyme
MMDSGVINLSTGPVQITAEVKQALINLPIPHRSKEFADLLRTTSEILTKEYKVKNCFLLTGSGTLANDVMLHQVRSAGGKGLILANGEFGERLIDQATRIGLDFIILKLPWGEPFDLHETEQLIRDQSLTWMIFTHCETSTGVINDLDGLSSIAGKYYCRAYVDCMSTIGTKPIDLSKITMATASSGKGLASIPGIAIVLSNIDPLPDPATPSYFDLAQYLNKSGVPFTLSSNLLDALKASIRQKLTYKQYSLREVYSEKISVILSSAGLLRFDHKHTHVFTLVPSPDEYDMLLEAFMRAGLIVSYESEYLRKRKWIQLALFNFYTERELISVVNKLEELVLSTARQKLLTNF